jgi:hypothetical protein
MKRLNTARIGIDQGSLLLFADFENGGPMWTGEGAREVRRAVRFAEPFADAPVVSVGIGLWDMDRRTNMRAEILAESVGREGFEIVFRTWGDSRVARIRADWMAIGPAPDPEFWDV